MRINTNVHSLRASFSLGATNSALGTNYERLTTGLRINQASDEAASLGVSEFLRSEIRGMNQAMRNVNDGISMLQVAEGTLEEVQSIVHRLRELSIQSASNTLATGERAYIELEKNELVGEIDRLATSSNFNGISLLTQTANTGLEVQVGAGNSAAERISLLLDSALASDLGIGAGTLDLSSASSARLGIDLLDVALASISEDRAEIGVVQKRLAAASNALANSVVNTSAAESQIRDADIAVESAQMGRNQVLQQTGVSILAQANASPQLMSKLLS